MATAKKKLNPANPLDRLVGQYAEKQKRDVSAGLEQLGIFDFMVKASPFLQKPLHLSPVLPYFEAIEKGPQFFCFSAPPRHGKSLLTNHFVARLMLRKPGIRIAYGCYSLDLSAGFFSGEVKDILTSNGVELNRQKNAKEEWELANGSSFKAIAPGSGFTGRGADLIIIDDPLKDRAAAESGVIRETTWNWVRDVCITRRSPTCSIVTTHTRWHAEDVIGRLHSKHNIPFINLQAINPMTDLALWEEMWPRQRFIDEVKPFMGEYGWASLYMGEPIPRGGAVFKDPTFYTDADFAKLVEEKKIVKYIVGIDCAYSQKTHSDYSVACVIAVDVAGNGYLVDVRRKQCEAPEFGALLKELRQTYNYPGVYWYTGGQEGMVAAYFRNEHGVPVKDMPARDDKFVRAQAVAAAWNSGRLKFPEGHRPWKDAFIAEVLVFSGLDDPHDDQVDALAASWVPLSKPQTAWGMSDQPIPGFW